MVHKMKWNSFQKKVYTIPGPNYYQGRTTPLEYSLSIWKIEIGNFKNALQLAKYGREEGGGWIFCTLYLLFCVLVLIFKRVAIEWNIQFPHGNRVYSGAEHSAQFQLLETRYKIFPLCRNSDFIILLPELAPPLVSLQRRVLATQSNCLYCSALHTDKEFSRWRTG